MEIETTCAHKGRAAYHAVRLGERLENGLAWTYPEPRPEAAALAGYVCFFSERVETEIDGDSQQRPENQWSSDEWIKRAGPRR